MAEIADLRTLDRLEYEFQQLLAKNNQLKADVDRVRSQRDELEADLKAAEARIAEMQQTIDRLLVTVSVKEVAGGARSAKIRLNRMLKEVDRCIALVGNGRK